MLVRKKERRKERKKDYACQVWPCALREGHLSFKAGLHHTDQEEEQAQKSTPAIWPPPWDLRHDRQAGPAREVIPLQTHEQCCALTADGVRRELRYVT
eukprot:11225-Pelagomonas_calceolata.AAC.1